MIYLIILWLVQFWYKLRVCEYNYWYSFENERRIDIVCESCSEFPIHEIDQCSTGDYFPRRASVPIAKCLMDVLLRI